MLEGGDFHTDFLLHTKKGLALPFGFPSSWFSTDHDALVLPES